MTRLRPWKSKRLMFQLYVQKKMSEQEIADKLNTDQSTINRWLRKHQLKR